MPNSQPRDEVVRALTTIVEDFGPSVSADPSRVRGLLNDVLAVSSRAHRREVDAIVLAAAEHIADGAGAAGQPKAGEREAENRLVAAGMSPELANFAVEAWTRALHVVPASAPAPVPAATELPPALGGTGLDAAATPGSRVAATVLPDIGAGSAAMDLTVLPPQVAEPDQLAPTGHSAARPRGRVLAIAGGFLLAVAAAATLVISTRSPQVPPSAARAVVTPTPSTPGSRPLGQTLPPTPAAAPVVSLPRAATPLPLDTLVWCSKRGDNWDLYRIKSDGTGERRLTRGAQQDRQPYLSPDRRTILYVRDGSTLRVTGADGSGDRRLFGAGLGATLKLVPDSHQSWSPDGASLLVAATGPGGVGLYVVSMDGHRVRRLPTSGSVADPAWSPDGRRIAFWAASGTQRVGGALYVVAADGGSRPIRLTSGNGALDSGPAWSPDGKSLAFNRHTNAVNASIWVMTSAGTGAQQLTASSNSDGRPAWSPDGARLTFSRSYRNNRDMYVMDATGKRQRPVFHSAATDSSPTWGSS